MFLRPSRRQAQRESIERLYGAIVAQSRLPSFYLDYGVPDTPEGRFDLLVLHVHLAYRRLAEDEATHGDAQELFDYFIADMDAAMRELGVGDMKVGKKMRGIGEAYYGRANAYDAALKENGDEALVSVLQRNVFGGNETRKVEAGRLAHYVRSAVAALASQNAVEIAGGAIAFLDPEQVSR
jgi:cytochrome b pre-mRNA-processing protein 3